MADPLTHKLESSTTQRTWRKLREILFLKPIIFFVMLYDKYWASKLQQIPDHHEMMRRVKGQSPMHAPTPLPRKRTRALTNPLPPIASIRDLRDTIRRSRQQTHEQSASLFLRMLPLEIRQLIYRDVLAGGDDRRVHILRKYSRLGHWRCRMQNGETECDSQARKCVEGWLSYRERNSHLDNSGLLDVVTDGGLLSLLLTCRLVYTESISTLYSKNIFHFYDPGDIRHFAGSVLPQRLNSVQSLMIDWGREFGHIHDRSRSLPAPSNNTLRNWRTIWGILAGMSGLVEVQVTLKKHVRDPTRNILMCNEMWRMQGLRKFDLIVLWDDDTNWDFASNAPFRVIKGPAPGSENE